MKIYGKVSFRINPIAALSVNKSSTQINNILINNQSIMITASTQESSDHMLDLGKFL